MFNHKNLKLFLTVTASCASELEFVNLTGTVSALIHPALPTTKQWSHSIDSIALSD